MTVLALPTTIQSILNRDSEPDAILAAILPVLGEVLRCDRCFLYLRNPQTNFSKVPFCWRKNQEIPDVSTSNWELDPELLPEEDPLFAAALRTDPSIYIEDVETANPEVVNKDFERRVFGHRALVHAHLCQNGELWGILQPCVFGEKRVWSEYDRAIITQLESKLTPLVVSYVKANNK